MRKTFCDVCGTEMTTKTTESIGVRSTPNAQCKNIDLKVNSDVDLCRPCLINAIYATVSAERTA
jgi:uncharacterized Zn finger protein (UPF0148 family)